MPIYIAILIILVFILVLSGITFFTVSKYLNNRKSSIELEWNVKNRDKLKEIYRNLFITYLEDFNNLGIKYKFWNKKDLEKLGKLTVFVQQDFFEVEKDKFTAGYFSSNERKIRISLIEPIKKNGIIEKKFLGSGFPWETALIHETVHAYYYYLFNTIDYNHYLPGDGLGGKGSWEKEHEKFIEEMKVIARKKFFS